MKIVVQDRVTFEDIEALRMAADWSQLEIGFDATHLAKDKPPHFEIHIFLSTPQLAAFRAQCPSTARKFDMLHAAGDYRAKYEVRFYDPMLVSRSTRGAEIADAIDRVSRRDNPQTGPFISNVF